MADVYRNKKTGEKLAIVYNRKIELPDGTRIYIMNENNIKEFIEFALRVPMEEIEVSRNKNYDDVKFPKVKL